MNNSDIQAAVLERLDELCKAKGISHYDMAITAEVPYSTVKHLFSGKTKTINVQVIAKLIKAFEIDLATFFDAPDFRGFEPDI